MVRYIAPLLIGLIGAAILIWLGLWQLDRLAWKQSLLNELDKRMDEAPIEMPAQPDPGLHQFQQVSLSGSLGQGQVLVFATVDGMGPRFRLIRPLILPDGRRILFELGLISPDLAEEVEVSGAIETQGYLYWPDEVDAFTPDHEPGTELWYARDLPAIALDLGTEPVLVIEAGDQVLNPLIAPSRLDPTNIPNNHMEYAVTWFGLALVWLGMTVIWLRRVAHQRYLES